MTRRAELRLAKVDKQVVEWNKRCPVETPVRFHPIIGEAGYRETVTRSLALSLSGHTACVFLQGESGCVALDACERAKAEGRP